MRNAHPMPPPYGSPSSGPRRHLLRGAAALAAGWLPVGSTAFAAVDPAGAASPAAAADTPRLLVVFLRGAVDGLNVVVPFDEPAYARLRPGIGLARPGQNNGVIALNRQFGLHPALQPLQPWWQAGSLAFVHASGSPDPTRSHFDAQDYMESGTPGRKSTQTGWMNRLLGMLPAAGPGDGPVALADPTRAICLGEVLPRIYAGPNAVATLATGPNALRPTPLDRPRVEQAFAQMYDGDDPLSQAFRQSRRAHREVAAAMDDHADATAPGAPPDRMQREMREADNGAPPAAGFPGDAARLATLMRRDSRVRLAFAALGGWDTHVNQGAATGQLAGHLKPLGQGLAGFAQAMGPAFEHTTVIVVSEFGRTARQNGNGGTDHGHGNVLWLLGGRVAGGQILGRWPGLEDAALHEGRDLAVTTDFRDVLVQVAARHLRVPDRQLGRLFPDFAPAADAPRVLRV